MIKLNKIHGDERGEIYTITGDMEHEEITILTTNKGFARGGCIHNKNDEYCVVLEGIIEYHLGNEPPVIMDRGKTMWVPRGTPHYIRAIKDSIVVEWGATSEEKKEKDPEMRRIVVEINKKWSEINAI